MPSTVLTFCDLWFDMLRIKLYTRHSSLTERALNFRGETRMSIKLINWPLLRTRTINWTLKQNRWAFICHFRFATLQGRWNEMKYWECHSRRVMVAATELCERVKCSMGFLKHRRAVSNSSTQTPTPHYPPSPPPPLASRLLPPSKRHSFDMLLHYLWLIWFGFAKGPGECKCLRPNAPRKRKLYLANFFFKATLTFLTKKKLLWLFSKFLFAKGFYV